MTEPAAAGRSKSLAHPPPGNPDVTIPAECPHCASVYQVSPDLAGKAMRCPNPDCKEVFSVRPPADDGSSASIPELPKTLEMPKPTAHSGGVADFVPVLKIDPADAPQLPSGLQHTQLELPYQRVESDGIGPLVLQPEPAPRPAADLPVAQPIPGPTEYLDKRKKKPADELPFAAFAPRLPTAPRLPDAPKQVAWTAEPPPPALPLAEPAPVADGNDDGMFVRSTPRKSPWPKFALTGLILAVVGVVVFIGYGALTYQKRTEEQLAEEAKEAYDGGKYTLAAEKYQALAGQSTDPQKTDEYKFFAALSDARATADSVSAREDPNTGREKLTAFLGGFGNSPYAQPDVTFGADVAQLGRKVADNLAEFGSDRLAKFRTDRAKMDLLEAAEAVAADGPKVLVPLEKFRGKESAGFDDQRKKFADIADAARKERDRLAVLAPFRNLADDPTDESIEVCELTLRRTGLANDAEAQGIVAKAKERLWKLIGSVPDARQAIRAPADLTPPILFSAAPLGVPEPRPTPDAVPDAVFAVARGVLYALDADTGRLLWGTRVGGMTGDQKIADVPVRVTSSEGTPEWVLVPSEVNGRYGLCCRTARTGEPVWYQPLDFPLAGRPAVVGKRAYVPLADPLGTVLEIQVSTGAALARLQIRQPVGAGLSAVRGLQSESGFLFVPADARRVFVFEVGKETDAGDREPPRMVRVVATDHPRDSLRGEPIVVNPPAGDGPRYLILAQSDGPTAMKLRSFPLPPPAELGAAGGPGPGGTGSATPAAEVTVPGWAWFPPAADGERVVASTDAGTVAIFGINQTGNADKALYALPTPNPTGDMEAVNRSLVVAVDEDSAWVVVGGKLTRLRTVVDAAGGLRIVPDGRAEPVGEPLHRAELRPSSGIGVVVTASSFAPGRATAFDPRTGHVRWQRHLGAIPAATPIVRGDKSALLVDRSGAVYAVPAGEPTTAVIAGVLAAPAKEPSAPAQCLHSADGSQVWVLIPEATETGKRLRVRHIADGAAKPDAMVSLPDLPAGSAILAGDSILIPLRDGAVYRVASGGLAKGPLWRTGANADAVCYLAAAGADEFLATDGAEAETGAVAWKWPADGAPQKRGGPWRARGPITAPPAVLAAGDGLRFAVADSAGIVRLFELAKQSEPVRQWRGAADGAIPPGPAGGRLDVLSAGGEPRLVYAANGRHIVCLDPQAADPAWVARGLVADDGPEVVGWSLLGNRLFVTDQTARITAVEWDTGKQLPDVPVGFVGLAAREMVPTADNRGLIALGDGTATVIPIPAPIGKKE